MSDKDIGIFIYAHDRATKRRGYKMKNYNTIKFQWGGGVNNTIIAFNYCRGYWRSFLCWNKKLCQYSRFLLAKAWCLIHHAV